MTLRLCWCFSPRCSLRVQVPLQWVCPLVSDLMIRPEEMHSLVPRRKPHRWQDSRLSSSWRECVSFEQQAPWFQGHQRPLYDQSGNIPRQIKVITPLEVVETHLVSRSVKDRLIQDHSLSWNHAGGRFACADRLWNSGVGCFCNWSGLWGGLDGNTGLLRVRVFHTSHYEIWWRLWCGFTKSEGYDDVQISDKQGQDTGMWRWL